QVTTASGLCSVLDLVLTNPERHHGLVTQESFRLPDILGNRFGRHLAAGGSKDISGDVVLSGAPGRPRALTSLTKPQRRCSRISTSRRLRQAPVHSRLSIRPTAACWHA